MTNQSALAKGTVAIDFDGVIHQYTRGWHDGSIYDPPMPLAFSAMIDLCGRGYAVYIHSTRESRQIVDWINDQQKVMTAVVIPRNILFWNPQMNPYIVGVTNRKLPALVYIDDRALRFTTWDLTMKDFDEREAHEF